MKWVEVIKVQTTQTEVVEKLMKLSREYKSCQGLVDIKVLSHATMTDCSVCLIWDTAQVEQQGSDIALSMSNTLKKYGLINHAVWVETRREEEKNHEKEPTNQKA